MTDLSQYSFTEVESYQGHAVGLMPRLPALLVLITGVAVVLLRPPLPVDETRYLEVLRESAGSSPWQLSLHGEPYADKPPLLFWIAQLLSLTGVSAATCLRLLPALASAGLAHIVGGFGRRSGLPLAGWMQAALLMPLLYSQYLLFDPLLAVSVWLAVVAWAEGRDRTSCVGAALALLAKGPVAYLFLALFFWALAPLRTQREGKVRRAVLLLVAALVPLATWALMAAATGEEGFARELLWERWAGRVHSSFAHQKPWFTYVPVVLVGSLPATLLLFTRSRSPLPWRRLGAGFLGLFVIFSSMSGKQPHYLLPAMPALALLLAFRLESVRGMVGRLRTGGGLLVLLFAVVASLAAGAPWLAPAELARLLDEAPEPEAWLTLWVPMALLLWGALHLVLRARLSAARLLLVLLVAETALLLPVHRVAARVGVPHRIVAALETIPPAAPLAIRGSRQGGYYSWVTEREQIPHLESATEVALWIESHPGGVLITQVEYLEELVPGSTREWSRGPVHGCDVVLLRVEQASLLGAE